MQITTTTNETITTLKIEGRLDTSTSPILEAEVRKVLSDTTELYLDLSDLDYVSSAGLRVFLMLQKTMNKHGKMVVQHANEIVLEIFEVTGFIDILTIE